MIRGAFVLKHWKVDVNPVDDQDHYVVIHARQAGLMAWILNLFGAAATTSLLVSSNRLEFSRRSLAGSEQVLIPLQNLSSTHSGYQKPWWQAIVVFMVLCYISITLIDVFFSVRGPGMIVAVIAAVIVSSIIAVVYYHLNRVYVWGVMEVSGALRYIPFKRSVIEGQDVTEESAAFASQVMQALIEAKTTR